MAFELPETKRSIRDESWETGAVKKDMKNPWRYSNVIVSIYIYMYLLFAMIVDDYLIHIGSLCAHVVCV